MRWKGVNYDAGTMYGAIDTRPDFDLAQVRRDLAIISSDLHCNAVRISGNRPGRLLAAAGVALTVGLEVWLAPLFHDEPDEVVCAKTVELAVVNDLDMASYGLVKYLPDGQHGVTYLDMPWEPKASFHIVARSFAAGDDPSLSPG